VLNTWSHLKHLMKKYASLVEVSLCHYCKNWLTKHDILNALFSIE